MTQPGDWVVVGKRGKVRGMSGPGAGAGGSGGQSRGGSTPSGGALAFGGGAVGGGNGGNWWCSIPYQTKTTGKQS